MLEAMFRAPVGDDVFGEDPSVNELEAKAAGLFGMEAGLFCPSGTMTNQIAIKCHTQPGDEVICDQLSHVYIYEGGGIAFNSGCQVRPLAGDGGRITADLITAYINPDDVHKPVTRLVSLENTANRGGGACYDFNDILSIRACCSQHNLALHLDGARLWNALVAKKEQPIQYGRVFDSISICLSKGLGTPVGSVLLGSQAFIKQARRVRKVMGGGMRQAGYLAAAGIYALEHHINRLEQDHAHAQLVAQHLQQLDFIGSMLPVETNILIFEVTGRYSAAALAEKLKAAGIYCIAISSTQVRMVFHLDVTPDMISRLLEVLQSL